MHRSTRIGLGFGVAAAVLIVVVILAHDTLKANPAAELAVNTTLNLVPVLAAAVGAYVAPLRKMISGMASGLLCLLPSLVIALLALGYVAPLVLLPLAFALVAMSAYALIGAALGTALSRLVAARQPPTLPRDH